MENDAAKKKWVTRYLPIDDSELCESLPSYTADDKTYEDFKTDILALYPGAGDTRKFSVADVEALVAARAANPITSIGELSSYYREFLAMTTYLIGRKRLSESEQSRYFIRGIRAPLLDQVSQRLQLKNPDHYPDDPYPAKEVYDAAAFVLHGTLATPAARSATTTAAGGSDSATVKVEDLGPLLRLLVQTVGEGGANALVNAANRGPPPQQNAAGFQQRFQPNYPPAGQRYQQENGNFCHYCGNPGCLMRNCPFIEEDVRAGRISRAPDGRVVLPNGNFVPRYLPGFEGVTMRDRVYEWHRRYPNSLLAPPPAGQAAQMVLSVSQDYPMMASYQLDAADRIAHLEHEIFALRQSFGRFDGVEIPPFRGPRARPPSPPRQISR